MRVRWRSIPRRQRIRNSPRKSSGRPASATITSDSRSGSNISTTLSPTSTRRWRGRETARLAPYAAALGQAIADREARERERDEDRKDDVQCVAEFLHQRRERLGREARALLRRQDARQQIALALQIMREAKIEDAAESRG